MRYANQLRGQKLHTSQNLCQFLDILRNIVIFQHFQAKHDKFLKIGDLNKI